MLDMGKAWGKTVLTDNLDKGTVFIPALPLLYPRIPGFLLHLW